MTAPPPLAGPDDGWRGAVSIRPGIVAFTGAIGSAELHAHAAVQVYWCHRGQIELTDAEGRTSTAPSAVIPAGAAHAVSATPGAFGTTVFVEPSSTWAPADGTWRASPDGWTDPRRSEAARLAATEALRLADDPDGSLGRRVEDWVRDRLPGSVAVTDLATELAISEAGLRRLARTELGLGVQTFARWVRLIVALEHVAGGATITDAAAAAGFADGSHATRACREMFGMTPSDAIAQLTVERT